MLDQYRSLIDELLETPSVVRETVEGASDDASDDAWTLVAALHSRDEQLLERMQRMRQQSSAHLKVLPGVDDAVDAAELPVDRDETLAAFETTRGNLVSTLMNLTLSDWSKQATHDAGGSVELGDEVEDHVDFDEAIKNRLEALT